MFDVTPEIKTIMKTTSELTRDDLENFSKLNNFDLMPPPRMTMDEYNDFIWEALQFIPSEQIERQKKREKQIKVAFHF